jgi:tyrosyl-tRNA synthetase
LKNKVTGYIGFDPTADSLHIGSLIPIILLMHLKKAGHRPIALVGGATGMVGDPSGKSDERNLLDEATLNHNIEGIKKQISKFLDFEEKDGALLLNNFDWVGKMSFLEFIRDVGKHLTVNYMMAKDSVKKRIETGISFTEFSYQLIQGFDFHHLYKHHNCTLQMGGSDQWGNITTGSELVRRMDGGKAYAITTPLITKADGGKFGKSEGGNVWMDKNLTSTYKFYQFWLQRSDDEAEEYIKKFTFLDKETVFKLIADHKEAPHQRLLQNTLADEVTTMVHSADDLEMAKEASKILFGKATFDALNKFNAKELAEIFEGVPSFEIAKADIESGLDIVEFLADKTQIQKSNGEARRSLKENAISINKAKVKMDTVLTTKDVLDNGYILAQKGKKNYFLVAVV